MPISSIVKAKGATLFAVDSSGTETLICAALKKKLVLFAMNKDAQDFVELKVRIYCIEHVARPVYCVVCPFARSFVTLWVRASLCLRRSSRCPMRRAFCTFAARTYWSATRRSTSW